MGIELIEAHTYMYTIINSGWLHTIISFFSHRWWIELYLAPSSFVYTTASVLCGLFAVIAIFVTVCHLRERHIDTKDRKRDKHQFHFNAM